MVDPVGAPAILGSLGEDRQRGTLQLQEGSNSHQERTLSGRFAMQWLSGILFCHETYCKPTFISVREIFATFARSSSLRIFLATN